MAALSRTPVTFRHDDPFSPEVIQAAKDHAIAQFPEESCGFVINDEYVPMENIHHEPEMHFKMDPMEVRRVIADAKVQAVVHSHPDGPNYPSFKDQQAQIEDGYTWGIIPIIGTTDGDRTVPIPSDIIWWGDALPIPPLEKRRFIWGVFHCYALFRDWWRVERGVLLPNFPCPPDFDRTGNNIFLDNCERAGLRNLGKVDMSSLQVGDMLVGHLRGSLPSHCGIYTGGDDFLHHAPDSVSGPAQLVRWWPHIDTVLRYDPTQAASIRGDG